jgi:hypothetical protein
MELGIGYDGRRFVAPQRPTECFNGSGPNTMTAGNGT